MNDFPVAYMRIRGSFVAVFGAAPIIPTDVARRQLLDYLTSLAKASGFRVDQAALRYHQGSQLQFFGASDLVRYLSSVGDVSRWTHRLSGGR